MPCTCRCRFPRRALTLRPQDPIEVQSRSNPADDAAATSSDVPAEAVTPREEGTAPSPPTWRHKGEGALEKERVLSGRFAYAKVHGHHSHAMRPGSNSELISASQKFEFESAKYFQKHVQILNFRTTNSSARICFSNLRVSIV